MGRSLYFARQSARAVLDSLEPFCERIEIAGSVRRCKPEVNDIEIVCVPRTAPADLFGAERQVVHGFEAVVNNMQMIRGNARGRYTRRRLPNGMEVDLFMVHKENWGYILAIRTGSAEWVKRVLATAWVRAGYHGRNGMLHKDARPVSVSEERDLFELLGMRWVEPHNREVRGVV